MNDGKSVVCGTAVLHPVEWLIHMQWIGDGAESLFLMKERASI